MKKITLLLVLSAIIRSSEVKVVSLPHGFKDWRLCANFDILRNNKLIDSSFQCGTDWKEINKGIRYQLQQIRDKEVLDNSKKDYLGKLNKIKDDEIGFVVE